MSADEGVGIPSLLFPARLLVLAPAFVLMLIMPPRLWLSIDEPALELDGSH